MPILPGHRANRKALPAHADDLDLPATAGLAGWHGWSGRSGIHLVRATSGNGRPYLAILIPEPLDGVELAMVRRFTHDMGAQFINSEPKNAA